jgi:hypothetical protein
MRQWLVAGGLGAGVALALLAPGVAVPAGATDAGPAFEVGVRGGDPLAPTIVLTNRSDEDCLATTATYGVVSLLRVRQGGADIEPLEVGASIPDALGNLVASRLVALAPGATLTAPISVVPAGPTGHALESMLWSDLTGPIGLWYPISPDRPVELELAWALPGLLDPAQCPATLSVPLAGEPGSGPAGIPGWLLVAALAVAALLVVLVVLVVLRRRGRRGGAVAVLLPLLAVGLVLVTPARPASAATDVHPDLQEAWDGCLGIFQMAGGDPGGILDTFLSGDGELHIIPTNGDETHHSGIVGGAQFIFWDPEHSHTYFGTGGQSDPCTDLYHEMYHAHEQAVNEGGADRRECVTDAGPSGIPIAEVNATRAQNQLRDKLDLPQRSHYGDKPLPSGDCQPPPEPGEDQPGSPPPPGSRGCGSSGCGTSNGDPHLRTLDGRHYDFQAVGEFVAVATDDGDVQVQLRLAPAFGSRLVSINAAVAAHLLGDVVEFGFGSDGTPRMLVAGAAVAFEPQVLPGGGQLSVTSGARGPQVYVDLTDGSWLAVMYRQSGLGVRLSLADQWQGLTSGLLGDFDGDRDNDLVPRDGGTPLADPTFDELYPAFADSWRITDVESLFTYPTGLGTADFTDLTMPERQVTAADLPNRSAAEIVCRRAGVTDPQLLEDCVLDVGLTGQAAFAESAAVTQHFLRGSRTAQPVAGLPVHELEITEPGGVARHEFAGRAGQSWYVHAFASDVESDCGALQLRGPTGQRLAHGCVINNTGHIDTTTLLADGVHEVVWDPRGDRVGRVRFQLVEVDHQTAEIVTDGTPVTSVIGLPGVRSQLTFDARAGDVVFVHLPETTLPNACSPIHVDDPAGRTVRTGCVINGHGYADRVELAVSGEHTVVIDPEGSRTGTSQVRLYRITDEVQATTAGAAPLPASVDTPGGQSRITFPGTAQQRIQVQISDSTVPNSCSTIRLLDPSGTTVASGCIINGRGDLGDSGRLLPTSGSYTVVIDPAAADIGASTVRITLLP